MKLVIALLLPSIVFAGPAGADPIVERCVEAHHDAQTARRDHHLAIAKTELATCAQAGCPRLIASDCQRWLSEVDAQLPSVIVSANDPAARLYIDDTPVAADRAIDVDPGPHRFRAEAPGKLPADQTVDVTTRDQHVELALVVGPVAPVAPVPVHRSRVPYLLGGIGVVGLGVAAGFGGAGLVERGRLDDRHCAPNCPPAEVDTIHRNFAIADIALGLGVIAVASAIVYYVLDKPAAEPLTVRF